MGLANEEFNLLRDYIYNLSGIALTEGRTYIMRQRLGPIVESVGCASFFECYERIQEKSPPKIEEQIVNAIITNETAFFRDGRPICCFSRTCSPVAG